MYSTNFKLNSRPEKTRRRFVLVFVALIFLALLAAGSSYYYIRNRNAQNAEQTQKLQSEAQTDSAKNTSQDATPSNENIKQDVPESTIAIVIDSVSQTNGQVNSSATLSSGDGDCVFTYTIDQDKPVTQRTTSTNSICTSSAPEVEFSRLGKWNLNVTAYVGGEKTEANQSVIIN